MLGALLRQAWILSVLYLVLGVAVSLARRVSEAPFLTAVSRMLDAVAQAILMELHLWPLFVRAVAFGQIPAWGARLVLASITVVLIHLQALLLALIFIVMHSIGVRSRKHRDA